MAKTAATKHRLYDQLPSAILAMNTSTLVPLSSTIPGIVEDLRYATSNNVCGRPLYASDYKALLREDAAEALKQAADEFKHQNLTIVIWDAYRPVEVQRELLEVCADERYVAVDSNHCKGITVDMTLQNDRGELLDMGTDHDEFSDRAHSNYDDLTAEQLKNRQIAKEIMEKFRFKQLATEWWHFDYEGDTA